MVKTDEDILCRTASGHAVGAGQLDAAFGGFCAGGEWEDLAQFGRGEGGDGLFEFEPNLRGETIGMVQAALGGFDNGGGNLGAAMPGAGDQHAAGEIEPLVTPGVEHVHAGCPVPHHGRLAPHAAGFGVAHTQQVRQGFWHGHRGDHTPVGGMHGGGGLGFQRKTLACHGGLRKWGVK